MSKAFVISRNSNNVACSTVLRIGTVNCGNISPYNTLRTYRFIHILMHHGFVHGESELTHEGVTTDGTDERRWMFNTNMGEI